MSVARAWRGFVLASGCVCGSWALARGAAASPTFSAGAGEAGPMLGRVEVAMLGEVQRDPLLFERIRSLFPRQTVVARSESPELDEGAVLSPRRTDTVYIWIRVTERTVARVYLTLAEPGDRARYLFREIGLTSGLDEVGSETLAEVAHSSARALWLREQQSPRQTLVDALEREARTQPEPPPALEPAAVVAISASPTPRDSTEALSRSLGGRRAPSAVRLGVGASGMMHDGGREGWLQEIGAFFAVEFGGRFSLRTGLAYLVPAELGLRPARVRLSGVSGELRAGWLSGDDRRLRVRLEAGLGALFASARAAVVDGEPKAHVLGAQDFSRGYALTAIGLEWPIGPGWLAASADLRVPLGRTSYEIGGQPGALTSASLCPGVSLEVGFGFAPALR